MRSGLLRRIVIEPPAVAAAILAAIERDRREVFIPRLYRVAAVAQALAPGLVARAIGRRAYRARAE